MNPTILIVDDEPAGREALESVLMTKGYKLAFAANGSEAMLLAGQLLPDLILLDVMMPDMDGYEVCRRLRRDPVLAEVPVVMVTALDDRESRLGAIESGADDFITKPIDRAELRARVQSITRLNRYRHLKEERARLERQLERLTALRSIDLAISTSMDLRVTLNIVLQHVMDLLAVDAAAVLLLDSDSQTLEYAAGRGFRTDAIRSQRVRLGRGMAGRAAYERRILSVPDLKKNTIAATRQEMFRLEYFQAYHAIPLLSKGQVKGVLEVFQRAPLEPAADWFDFLETLAQQAAIAIENSQLFERLQRSNAELLMAYDATIEGWSRALDLRDKETEGHTLRVTEMTLDLARVIDLREPDLVYVRWGALLHDIGKLGVPDSILLKPDALTPEEWAVMRKHPTNAYRLLSPVAYLHPALDIPYCHHERWDGTGYPRGLQGEQIPLVARIFAVVDVWDALRSDRPYRPGWPEEKILAHIRSQSGSHFDPARSTGFHRDDGKSPVLSSLICFRRRGVLSFLPKKINTVISRAHWVHL